MRAQLAIGGEDRDDVWDNPDVVIIYEAKFDEYGLPVRDGGASMITVGFCPWCGGRLPQSKRDAWFDEMQRRGIDPWTGDLPPDCAGAAWWADADADAVAGIPVPAAAGTGAAGTGAGEVEPGRVISPW